MAKPIIPRSPDDPWENENRKLYAVNDAIDRAALHPAATFYTHAVPRPARVVVANFVTNLDEPRVTLNDMLQGRLPHAGTSGLRFLINSTLGIGGLFDVAKHIGLTRHENDFGLTMARMNVPPGPYLFVPLLGPSNVRDLTGATVDLVIDPLSWAAFRGKASLATGTTLVDVLDSRADIEPALQDVRATSADPYAKIRSVYAQVRSSDARDGAIVLDDFPNFPASTTANDVPPDAAPDPAPVAAPIETAPVS